MAYVSSHSASAGIAARFDVVVTAIKARMARRAIYVQTLRELESLSDRDLLDLGISPQSIHAVAAQAAYGH